jgi:hypothetical protein
MGLSAAYRIFQDCSNALERAKELILASQYRQYSPLLALGLTQEGICHKRYQRICDSHCAATWIAPSSAKKPLKVLSSRITGSAANAIVCLNARIGIGFG